MALISEDGVTEPLKARMSCADLGVQSVLTCCRRNRGWWQKGAEEEPREGTSHTCNQLHGLFVKQDPKWEPSVPLSFSFIISLSPFLFCHFNLIF